MIIDLNHVNIVTTKLDETRDFFTEVLGLTVGYRPDFGIPGWWLYAGDKPVVHLIAPRNGEAVRPAPSPFDHAAFEIADVEEAMARLKAHGVSYRQFDAPDGRARQLFFNEPNGVTIELIARRAA
jgi:catechol 2,3-dioxygenase-like lactoylglutathione lyase family enzyme